ncbi:ciliary-associated calcium-binding coiled-coil protein 1 isoform 4-T4 [Hipposideros larvatus]
MAFPTVFTLLKQRVCLHSMIQTPAAGLPAERPAAASPRPRAPTAGSPTRVGPRLRTRKPLCVGIQSPAQRPRPRPSCLGSKGPRRWGKIMATSGGTVPGGTTPAALTPVGTSTDSERDAEFQEHEKILSPDFLSVAQITEMLAEDVDGVQQKLEMFLNFKNIKTCLKEAILLDYYVSGFLWARGMDFSIIQYSQFMTLLDMLLHNLKTLHMSLEDSLKWLGEVMAEIGPSHLQKNENWNIFDIKQANGIIDYLKISLFQHYKLYEFLFYSTREEIVIGAEVSFSLSTPSICELWQNCSEGLIKVGEEKNG